LARTCLEAVKDPLGNKIGGDIAEVVARAPCERTVGVVDPFAGSCNGLYAILRHLPGAKGMGFEVEAAVFDLTTRNIAHLKAPIELFRGSYKDLIGSRRHPADHLIVVFLGPPWGDALQPDTGLHLDRTKPPILEIVRDFRAVVGNSSGLPALRKEGKIGETPMADAMTGKPLIESDRVEGTTVYDPQGTNIGTIKRLMIEKLSGRVAYAIMSFGGFLGMGTEEHAVPWSKLTYDTNLGGYRTDLTEQQLKGAPAFSRDRTYDWGDRDRERELHDYYRAPYYW
jgi:PRC-barrel domain